jgi:hypothetical protein
VLFRAQHGRRTLASPYRKKGYNLAGAIKAFPENAEDYPSFCMGVSTLAPFLGYGGL